MGSSVLPYLLAVLLAVPRGTRRWAKWVAILWTVFVFVVRPAVAGFLAGYAGTCR